MDKKFCLVTRLQGRHCLTKGVWFAVLSCKQPRTDIPLDMEDFFETVRRYTNVTTITKRMVAELIDHNNVHHETRQGVAVSYAPAQIAV